MYIWYAIINHFKVCGVLWWGVDFQCFPFFCLFHKEGKKHQIKVISKLIMHLSLK